MTTTRKHDTTTTSTTTPTTESMKEIAMPTTAAAPTATLAPPLTADDPAARYAHYLPLALALPASADGKAFRSDVGLATLNAARGAKVILDHAASLATDLPKLDLDAVRSLSDLGSALAFAQAQVERFSPSPTNIKAQLAEARRLRTLLLTAADLLVILGVVPAATVAKIRKGQGPRDTAGDCVALAALFTKHGAEVTAKVAVTATDIANANSIGGLLLRLLQPATAKKVGDPELAAATNVRDRLWLLFERTWRVNVWRAGAWLFDREVELHVPLLHSRVGGRRAASGTVPPATVAAPVVAAPVAAAPVAAAPVAHA